jgi:hypothetical protein
MEAEEAKWEKGSRPRAHLQAREAVATAGLAVATMGIKQQWPRWSCTGRVVWMPLLIHYS